MSIKTEILTLQHIPRTDKEQLQIKSVPPTRRGLLCQIHDKASDAWVAYGNLSTEADASGFYVYFFEDGLREQKYPTIRDFLTEHAFGYRFRFIRKRKLTIERK